MKVTRESEVAQSHPIFHDPTDCSLPGSSVHGIFQARALGWGAIASSACLEATISSVAQSCPTLCNPMNRSMLGLPAITSSQSIPKLMSIESVMSSSHLILCCPLLLLPSIFPSIRVFSNEPLWLLIFWLRPSGKLLWILFNHVCTLFSRSSPEFLSLSTLLGQLPRLL